MRQDTVRGRITYWLLRRPGVERFNGQRVLVATTLRHEMKLAHCNVLLANCKGIRLTWNGRYAVSH